MARNVKSMPLYIVYDIKTGVAIRSTYNPDNLDDNEDFMPRSQFYSNENPYIKPKEDGKE